MNRLQVTYAYEGHKRRCHALHTQPLTWARFLRIINSLGY